MSRTYDVLIVGSGPAGVSAAFPLVEAGRSVLMVDGGAVSDLSPPRGEYLELRRHDEVQWEWMVGRHFEALANAGAFSPKLRAPPVAYVFRDFGDANSVATTDFVPVGSLAVGGLSNAWGTGVSRYSVRDLDAFPFPAQEFEASFARVARRVGLSGAADDDLAEHCGVDAWADPPVGLDTPHRAIAKTYAARRSTLAAQGFRLGHARVAALSRERGPERRACTKSGLCLWGCAEGALYSARFDVASLARHPNFTHRPGVIVDRIEPRDGGWAVRTVARSPDDGAGVAARAVVLAAGTLATTRIALRSLDMRDSVPLLSQPFAPFALWLPWLLGASREPGTGLAQLAFALDGADRDAAYGYTFSTHALPIADFVRGTEWTRRGSLRLLSALLSSVVVANCFLPASLSADTAHVNASGALHITGRVAHDIDDVARRVAARLRRAFRRLDAVLLPGTFRLGAHGADAHYAGTLPMRAHPRRGETDGDGALAGLDSVYVADAAAFPALPEKPHTLSMMACADRVGAMLAARLRAGRA